MEEQKLQYFRLYKKIPEVKRKIDEYGKEYFKTYVQRPGVKEKRRLRKIKNLNKYESPV